MMHQLSGTWFDGEDARTDATGIAALAYRSRAVTPPTRAELDQILRAAQSRNASEGLTGLLIYDQGYFFQWLEGPRLGLARVWESIRRDARHSELQVLRQDTIKKRFFKGWDMRLARRTRGEIDKILTVMEVPNELLSRLRIQPSVLADRAWDQLFGDAVIPRLAAVQPLVVGRASIDARVGAIGTARNIWHAHREAGSTLARVLMAVDPGDTPRYVDTLVDQGAGLEPLFHEVFEPAARWLGGLWEDDRCDDFTVALALGRLQLEVHRLSAVLPIPGEFRAPPGRTVLVAQQPGEPHGLNATLSSELFSRDGWDVSREMPQDDSALRDMLNAQWFDVLELSASGAVRREHQLPAMRLTIRAARAASKNPSLAVIVDGRSFFERPLAYLDVGADIACVTSTDSVPAAQHLLTLLAARTPSSLRSEQVERLVQNQTA